MRQLLPVASLALSLPLTACGNDAGTLVVDAAWWINSVDATTGNCAEQGIATVRVKVGFEDASEPQSARFDCVEGHGQLRVPRPRSPGFSLPDGANYHFVVDALDADGNVLQTAEGGFDATSQSTVVELPVVDIFVPFGRAASLSAVWQFAGSTDLPSACTAHGVTHVALDVAAASDPDFTDSVELDSAPCAQGILTEMQPVLATGEYWVRYVALGPQGSVVQQGDGLELSVQSAGQDLPIAPWTFQ